MWGDDRLRIRREEDRVYRIRSARLGYDHQCFCYGMRGRPHLVLVEPRTVNLLNFYFIFLQKRHFSLWGKLNFLWNLHWLVEYNRHPSCVSNFWILFKLHFSIWLVELWPQMNFAMFLAAWTRCWAPHRQWVQSEIFEHQILLTDLYCRSTFDPKRYRVN